MSTDLGKKFEAWRVVTAWNRFTLTLRNAALIYLESQRYKYYATFRKFPFKKTAIGAIPFIVYLIIFKNYNVLRELTGLDKLMPPNITILPIMEEALLGCLPHRILARFANPFLDFFAAVPYLIHFPLPGLFVAYLYLSERRRRDIFPFLWLLGWVNLCGVIVQFIFPTAPPWYTDTVVFDASGKVIDVGPAEAGFVRVDQLMGFSLFHDLYSKSPLKFGAFPSLHVAWPMVVLASGPWISWRFGLFHVVWITWAAMYSNHHYFVDALMGIAIVLFVAVMSTRFWSPFRNFTIEVKPVLPRFNTRL